MQRIGADMRMNIFQRAWRGATTTMGGFAARVARYVRLWSFSDEQKVTDPSAGSGQAGRWLPLSGYGPQDRPWADVLMDLVDALDAWRQNFLIRQIVRLTTAYVVGDGVKVSATHPWCKDFVSDFWTDKQNRMASRLPAWCDELTRAGELFIALFPNRVTGMQYVRAIPARQITSVETDPEDYEKETGYVEAPPPLPSPASQGREQIPCPACGGGLGWGPQTGRTHPWFASSSTARSSRG
jgi:hypothetical protein